MYTYQFIDEHFQGGIIVNLGTVEVDEEEDVSPHVVFVSDVMIKPLKTKQGERINCSVIQSSY